MKSSHYKSLVNPQLWATTNLEKLLEKSSSEPTSLELLVELRNVNASYEPKMY